MGTPRQEKDEGFGGPRSGYGSLDAKRGEAEWEEMNLAETCRSRMQVELRKKGG